MDFFKSKGRKWHYCIPLHIIWKDVEFVSSKDTIYFIMQCLQTCYRDEYKLCGKSQLFFYEGKYHLSK